MGERADKPLLAACGARLQAGLSLVTAMPVSIDLCVSLQV
jgi:hypothetical protein